MRRKNYLPLIVLAVAFVLLVFLLLNMFSSGEKTEVKPLVIVEALIAPENMVEGAVINLAKMAWKPISEEQRKDTYITKAQTDLLQQIEGAVVLSPILKDEFVEVSSLIQTRGKSSLSAVIREGMRAVSVPFSKLANAPSLIAPGDIIDIILPKRAAVQSEGYFGETILSNLKVLAVDKTLKKADDSDNKATPPQSVTLEVSMEQAENLAASIRDGQVVISMHSIFARAEGRQPNKVVNQPTSKEIKVVRVIRGTEKKEVTLNQAGK